MRFHFQFSMLIMIFVVSINNVFAKASLGESLVYSSVQNRQVESQTVLSDYLLEEPTDHDTSHHDEDEDDHGNDEHHSSSSAHEAAPGTLFGAYSTIKPKIVAATMAIIVGAVLIVEYVFHGLHELTHDTPFHKMVSTIEKELMIVGCTAFIFKIFVNTTTLEHDWFFALEYSDLLVPLFSFANCLLGVVLIMIAMRQCKIWSKAFHLRLEEVLDDFYNQQRSLHFRFSMKSLYNSVAEMEFRIFHCVFCDMFRIQRKAFAFDEYVELVFEKYVMNVIKLSLLHWFIFLVLLLLNIARSDGGMYFHGCEHTDIECIDHNSALLFTVGGAGLYFVTCVIALVSRQYEVAIIAKRGINGIDEYPEFLQHERDMYKAATATTGGVDSEKLLNEEDLKNVVNEAKLRLKMKKSHHGAHHGLFAWLTTPTQFMHTVAVWCGCLSGHTSISPEVTVTTKSTVYSDKVSNKNVVQTSAVTATGTAGDGTMSSKSQKKDVQNEDVHYDIEANNINKQDEVDDVMGFDELHLQHRQQLQQQQEGVEMVYIDEQQQKASNDVPVVSAKLPRIEVVSESDNQQQLDDNPLLPNLATSSAMSKSTKYRTVQEIHKKADFVKDVFWLQRPDLYFEAVRMLIMFIALYLAMWLVNYLGSTIAPIWKFITIVPGILSAINFFYSVKTAAMLKAICHIDNDAVLEVIEQTEGSRLLGETIRDKLLKKLQRMGDAQEQLRNLFNEIDDNDSNLLSRQEFEVLMNKMDINFSRKKWKQIYHEIDRNFDDLISFEEFFLFMFPHHDEAKAIEKKRLKVIRDRVSNKVASSKKVATNSSNTKPSYQIGLQSIASTSVLEGGGGGGFTDRYTDSCKNDLQ